MAPTSRKVPRHASTDHHKPTAAHLPQAHCSLSTTSPLQLPSTTSPLQLPSTTSTLLPIYHKHTAAHLPQAHCSPSTTSTLLPIYHKPTAAHLPQAHCCPSTTSPLLPIYHKPTAAHLPQAHCSFPPQLIRPRIANSCYRYGFIRQILQSPVSVPLMAEREGTTAYTKYCFC